MKRALCILGVLGLTMVDPRPASAGCLEFGGFAIFQCAYLAYFDAPPEDAGDVETLFWQIGYGNADKQTGTGSSGTGVVGFGTGLTFNGNDSGVFDVDM